MPFTTISTEWKNGLKKPMEFNKLKYKILHLGQENSMHSTGKGEGLRSSFAQKDPGEPGIQQAEYESAS